MLDRYFITLVSNDQISKVLKRYVRYAVLSMDYFGPHAKTEVDAIRFLSHNISTLVASGFNVPFGALPTEKEGYKPVQLSNDPFGRATYVVHELLPLVKVREFHLARLWETEEEKQETQKRTKHHIGQYGHSRQLYFKILYELVKKDYEPVTSHSQLYSNWNATLIPFSNVVTDINKEGKKLTYFINTLTDKDDERNTKLSNTEYFNLFLLCILLIPSELMQKLSSTYASMLYALLTGNVVPLELDPTISVPLWNTVTQHVMRQLGMKYYDFLIENHPDGVPKLSSYYLIAEAPELEPVIQLLIQVNAIPDKSRGSFRQGDKDPEYLKEVEVKKNFLKQWGFRPDRINGDIYWSKYHSSFSDAVYSRFPYFMYRLIGYPRPPLPRLFDQPVTKEEKNILLYYSDDELLRQYFPKLAEPEKFKGFKVIAFGSYDKFVDILTAAYTEKYFAWHIIGDNMRDGLKCANSDFYSAVEGEYRRDLSVKYEYPEKDNPRVRYGIQHWEAGDIKMRCFTVNELTENFRETEYGFEFCDPDWIPALPDGTPVPEDPLTGRPLSRTFTKKQIKGLKSHLKTFIINLQPGHFGSGSTESLPNCQALMDKIDLGIRRLGSVEQFLSEQQMLLSEHPEWRNDLLIYFSWMFLFSMWIRFWTGPGTPYPQVWKDKHEGSCDALRRDEHVIIELAVHGILINSLEQHSNELGDYVKQFPYLHYDRQNDLITKPDMEIAIELLRTYTAEGVIDLVQLNDFCMAQASDILMSTAFVFLTRCLNVSMDRLNELLMHVIGLLSEIESSVIEARVKTVMSIQRSNDKEIKAHNQSLSTIEEHRSMLRTKEPGFVQEPLNFREFTVTGHLPGNFDEIMVIGGEIRT